MLETIIRTSIQRATLILVAIVMISALGVWNFTKLPIDAVPDSKRLSLPLCLFRQLLLYHIDITGC